MATVFSFRFLLGCLAIAAVVLALLELSFRVVLPASELPYYFFDKQEGIIRFDASRLRDGLYTFGNLAEIRAHWHVNANGWLSERDYDSRSTKPVIAVIGDSYVESLQVDSRDSMPSVLAGKLGNSYEVYTFGISGANLSQYLLMSRYVQRNFKPRVMIFNLVDGDILGSLVTADSKPGYLYFSCGAAGVQESLLPYNASALKSSFRKSALLRYLILNKGILSRPVSGSTSARAGHDTLSGDEIEKSRMVVDYAFARIRQENPGCSIIMVLDAPRNDIYRGKFRGINLESRRILVEASRQYGFHLVDLMPVMSGLYHRNLQKFNFDINDHWNEYGHRVVADQIYQALIQVRKAPEERVHE